MTGSARIFISYSRKDGAGTAAVLRKDIEAQNLRVWQDIVAMEGGRHWASQIEAVLKTRALQHFVLVVTPAALESAIVRWEIRLARQEGKTVSPVRGQGLGDLGKLPHWLGHIYDFDIPEQRAKLMSVLAGPSKQNRVPMMAPEPPVDFVQRPHEFGALKAKLLNPQGDAVAITAALRGAGGYGKTTLAKALAHDPDIADAYFDGILWVELGEKPGNLLSILSDLIETMTGERPGLENLNAAAAKLGEALGDRRILLIIDDAWREQDLHPFSHGGRNTTRLVTTRRDDILPPTAARQPVDAMQGGEALALLAWGLPDDQAAAQTHALQALAARLGEWAQLLKLVNGFLRDRVLKARQPFDQAIAGVNKRLSDKGLSAFDARDEAGRAKAIAKTIGVSLDLLDDAASARFAELAVFPEDVDVPIGIAAALWAKTGGLDEVDTEDLLVRLESLSLLLSLDLEQRTFRFHDTVRQFLQDQTGKEKLALLHRRLLDAIERLEVGRAVQTDRYVYLHLPAHLAAAGERDQLDALLLNPGWLQAKLDALDSPQALVADYDQFGQGPVPNLIGRTLRLTSGICTRDKRQLIPQLHGRLMSKEVAAPFCAEALRLLRRPAIVTIRPSLTPPGAELARFEGHGGLVRALAVLHDGRLASGSTGTVRLWDAKTGQELVRLEGHGGLVNALAVLPDGRLASGSDDKTIRLWDPNTAKELARLEGHGGAVNALAVLPDGRLASGSYDKTVRLWDATTEAELARLEGHSGAVYALAALPDGRLASGSADAVRLWDARTGAELARLEGDAGGVRALAVLADGRLASGSWDKTVRLWDAKTGTELAQLEGHSDNVGALAALPDGRLASGSSDKTVRLWDTKTGMELVRLEGHSEEVNVLAVLPDGRLASACGDILSYDLTIRLWDTKTGTELGRLEGHSHGVLALAALPDGRLASGSVDNTIRLWDAKSTKELGRLEGHTSTVFALAALSNGRVASSSSDNTIRLWDAKSTKELIRLQGHTGLVRALAALPDGRLASCSDDDTIRLWDTKTGIELARLAGKSVWALAVLPDGGLASGCGSLLSNEYTIRLCDGKTGAELARLDGHSGRVFALAVLPNWRLASGSEDLTVRLWDARTGAELARLEGHGGWVNALAALPDGRLASGSHDKTIRLWDAETAREVSRLEVDAAVGCLAALPDGRLVAGDALGRLHWLEILD
ncbi:MAG: NB-ARC domain-containing protein [Rhodomicrobium sp.]